MARHPDVHNLPGVGTRLDVDDVDGRPFTVVRRRDGHVEFHGATGGVEVDDAAARSIGAFVSGRFAMPSSVADRIDDVIGGLVFDYVTVQRGSPAATHSIEELAVRRRTGVTIVAILRGSVPVISPDPTTRLAVGDDLVVAGRLGDIEGLERYLSTGSV